MALLLAGLAACSSVRESYPERTATEQLLISIAADKAIEKLEIDPGLEGGTGVWFDASYFETYDEGYALSALRAHLLEEGVELVPQRNLAEVVVEARAGALSVNESSDLFGLPSLSLPVPLAGSLEVPEIAVYKREEQIGIAKFALTIYERESGRLIDSVGPAYGVSWRDRQSVLGLGWTDDNVGLEERPNALSRYGPGTRDPESHTASRESSK